MTIIADNNSVRHFRSEAIKEWKEAASNMSYYNAAEGDNWRRESKARSEARAKLDRLSDELGSEIVDRLKSEGNYLL